MNDPDFENQLRSIQPSRPTRSLEERIARDLAPAPVVSAGVIPKKSLLESLLPAFGWAGVGAATAVVVMLSLNLTGAIGPQPPAPQINPAPAVTKAESAENATVRSEVVDASEEGFVDNGAQGVSRVVRYNSIERHKWTDASGAITLVEIPREDVVLVPASVQ